MLVDQKLALRPFHLKIWHPGLVRGILYKFLASQLWKHLKKVAIVLPQLRDGISGPACCFEPPGHSCPRRPLWPLLRAGALQLPRGRSTRPRGAASNLGVVSPRKPSGRCGLPADDGGEADAAEMTEVVGSRASTDKLTMNVLDSISSKLFKAKNIHTHTMKRYVMPCFTP